MVKTDGLRRYIEAGAALGDVTRARADAIVRELVSAGELQREQAEDWVNELIEWSRRNSEALVGLVKREVNAQLADRGITPGTLDDLGKAVADLLRRSSEAGRTAARSARTARATKKVAKKSAKKAGKRGGKKAAAKKTAKKVTRKAAAKKTAKGGAKRAPARKAAPSPAPEPPLAAPPASRPAPSYLGGVTGEETRGGPGTPFS